MSTITQEQQTAIAAKLENMTLPSGLGDEHSACSIAAINLALSGRLTDDIPDCMSEVIGKWIIVVQDAMPREMRNSIKWKSLLPLAAGTGREREDERLGIILDWMWRTVLPSLQAQADAGGYGSQWRAMCKQRTFDAAEPAAMEARAAWAARATYAAAAYAANSAAKAAKAAGAAAEAAEAAAWAEAAWAATAEASAAAWTSAAAWRATRAAKAAKAAAWAARAATAAEAAKAEAEAAEAGAWDKFDPCALLERLVKS